MSLPTDWNAVRKALQSYLATAPEFPRRFAEARSRLVTLKQQSLAGVARWEWYTDFHPQRGDGL
jgi:hypothetical protein